MTDKEKKEYIGEILSIRSGLSIIYDNQIIIDNYFSEVNKNKISIENNEKNLDYYNTKIEEENNKLKEYKYSKEKIENSIKAHKKPTAPKATLNVAALVFGILSLCAAASAFFGFSVLISSSVDWGVGKPLLQLIAFVGGLGLIGLGIWLLTQIVDDHAQEKRKLEDDYERKEEKLQKDLLYEENSIISKEKELSSLNEKKLEYSEPLKELYVTREKLYSKYDSMVELQNQNDIFLKSLEENHTSIFCKRDWAYIDLILFYLNTDRADSLKEALQLVDRQVQTDQIVNAINSLSHELSSVIKYGIKYLGTTINNNFSLLSSQISQLSYSVNRNSKLLIEESKIEQKLLNNISVSSEYMTKKLDDVEGSNAKLIQINESILKLEAKQAAKNN